MAKFYFSISKKVNLSLVQVLEDLNSSVILPLCSYL